MTGEEFGKEGKSKLKLPCVAEPSTHLPNQKQRLLQGLGPFCHYESHAGRTTSPSLCVYICSDVEIKLFSDFVVKFFTQTGFNQERGVDFWPHCSKTVRPITIHITGVNTGNVILRFNIQCVSKR